MQPEENNIENKVGLLFTTIVLGTNFDSFVYYIITIFLFLFTLIKHLKILRIKKDFELIDLIPAMFILIWLYGIVLGFIRGNKTEHIIANFAGMSMYLSYYLFGFWNIKLKNLLKVLTITSLINILYCTVLYILLYVMLIDSSVIESNLILKSFQAAESSTGQNRLFWGGITTVFCLYSSKLSYILIYKQNWRNIFYNIMWIIICVLTLFFATASKGFLLALIFNSLTVIFFLSFKFNRKNQNLKLSINTNVWLLIVLCGIFISVVFTLKFDNIFSLIFSKEDSSNEIRYEQLYYIINEINMVGNGLGACLQSGYSRASVSSEACYGFELTYINLFHKFGIFALFLILGFIYTYIKSFSILKWSKLQNNQLKYIGVPIGAIMYTIPSLGNPMLFGPQTVLLHCIALYFLKCIKQIQI